MASMTQDEVFERVSDIVASSLGKDASTITMDMSFKDDLGADSLDLAQMIMDFEEAFDVGNIDDEAAMNIKTVGDAVHYIHGELAGK